MLHRTTHCINLSHIQLCCVCIVGQSEYRQVKVQPDKTNVCVKHSLCDVTASYRCSKEKNHSHDAALFNHGVSGVDLYGASGANDLKKKTQAAAREMKVCT